jgi:hypothetical protein
MDPPYEVGKDGFGVKDVKTNEEGWADAKLYRPYPYDLVSMRTQRKIIPGWWSGQKWEGLHLRSDDSIFFWKQEQTA